ncbi:hypothetical protein GALMADRAFT_149257 [Galerina marginata CBS 339.88]|uniref:Uncharacterized protein n=1 Tax=Galerina marginata (strain CBS 339.88) TaxID=685588 RepID=A0A067S4N6_GALM3|nr:hypothetical protein GALMADRAFT_149257 [Galerina marginata CBS 339.88]
MAKSRTQKQATHAETPYRRRSTRLHKASTNPLNMANNSDIPTIEDNNTSIEDTNMSEELQYPAEEHTGDLHLEHFVSNNLPLGTYLVVWAIAAHGMYESFSIEYISLDTVRRDISQKL